MEFKKDEILIKNVLEKIKRGQSTRFLDSKELYLSESILRKNRIPYKIYRPFEMSNYAILYQSIEPDVSIIKTKNIKFKHSDVMGSYFSLGLDKNIIGDIIVQEDMVYIFVLTKYVQPLINQFIFIKNQSVIFEKSEWLSLQYLYEEVNIIVGSNRIDIIISKLLNLSRSQSNDLFSKKEVILNYTIVNNNKRVKVNDIFSIRRYGKYVITGIESFKNKYKISLKKYI